MVAELVAVCDSVEANVDVADDVPVLEPDTEADVVADEDPVLLPVWE